MKKWISWKGLCYFIAVAQVPAYYWFLGRKGEESWTFAAFAALFLFIANLDSFVKLKVSPQGIEAEMRKAIDEAHATLDQVRELAKITTAMSISATQRIGRLGSSYSAEEMNAVKDKHYSLLKKFGVSEDEMESAVREHLNDMHLLMQRKYVHALKSDFAGPVNQIKHLNAGVNNLSTFASPDEIELVLNDADLLTEERKELLKDYRHYLEHKKHRRPKVLEKIQEHINNRNK